MENKIKIAFSLILGISTPMVSFGQEAATVPAPQVQKPQAQAQAKMAELEQEFQAISSKLSRLEMQAMENDEVATAKHRFQEKVEKAVLKEDPDLEDDLRKRGKYAEYIEAAQEGGELPDGVDINELYTKYNAIHQKVMPVEQKAMQRDDLQTAYQNYRQTLFQQMSSLDDNVMDHLERQQEIRAEYKELASNMRR